MARALSANIQALIAGGEPLRTVHLLTFTAGPTTYRFAEDLVTHLGNVYLPHLMVETGPRYSEQLQLHPVRVRLQNITLETAALLQAEGTNLQGQEATLERLFLAARETVVLFRGRISEIVVDEREATLTLTGDLDPSAAQVPRRKYSALCVWDFKDANCGYVDGLDPNDPVSGQPFVSCPKDLDSCQRRGRLHRFPGFLTITRELTETVERNMPDPEEDATLSELYE
jgi:hypothetical protein